MADEMNPHTQKQSISKVAFRPADLNDSFSTLARFQKAGVEVALDLRGYGNVPEAENINLLRQFPEGVRQAFDTLILSEKEPPLPIKRGIVDYLKAMYRQKGKNILAVENDAPVPGYVYRQDSQDPASFYKGLLESVQGGEKSNLATSAPERKGEMPLGSKPLDAQEIASKMGGYNAV